MDHIYVVNRDGEVLHENHRNPDGSLESGSGAREAILKERDRMPTPEEIGHFDTVVAYMRSSDPGIRAEPVDPMVAMAVDYAEHDHQALRRQGSDEQNSVTPVSDR